MVFCIRETGETREIYCPDSHGINCANDMAQNLGLSEDDDVTYDGELDVYVASRETVECWQKCFETAAENDQELRELKSKYADYEVDDLFSQKWSSDCYDPYVLKDILLSIRETLEKRFNPETAQLIGEHESELPQSDFRYFKEALYQQDTGKFFIAGEGGTMSGYGMEMSDGSMGYGERSFSLTDGKAQAWVKKRSDQEICINPF